MDNFTNIFLLYKITEKEYIKTFAQGEVFFSCCGKYVDLAKAGCEKGQGDRYECVFAKYSKINSSMAIQKYKKLFGDDLLIENDGDFILLRRKSSLLVPTTCFYSIDNETAINNLPNDEKKRIERIIERNKGKEKIRIKKFPLTIPQKYLDEFKIKDNNKDAMIIQPRDFLEKLSFNNVKYRKVSYIDTNEEYDIFEDELYKSFYGILSKSEAIEKRIEMFFKDRGQYSHQCELRCIIRDVLFTDHDQGMKLKLFGLSSTESSACHKQNATGKDFICYVKNNVFSAKVVIERKNNT